MRTGEPRPPDVSVVIPVHNGAQYVAQAIQSALDQEGVRVEVIVVDDASTDTTSAVVAAFGDRVQYVALPKQTTSIATTTAGIALATGVLVGILHHDDYYLPGKLRRHVDVMRANSDVGLSYSAQHYVAPGGAHLWTLRSPVAHHDYVVPGVVELEHMMVQNYLNFSNAIVRRSAYDAVGPYEEDLWFSAEWDMWTRLLMVSAVAYIDDPLVCYRLHPGSQTFTGSRDTTAFLDQLQRVLDRIYGNPRLPPRLRTRRRLSTANMYLSTALLQSIRREWARAAFSAGRALRHVRPWEVPRLLRSSALVPRMGSRLRLSRSGTKLVPRDRQR